MSFLWYGLGLGRKEQTLLATDYLPLVKIVATGTVSFLLGKVQPRLGCTGSPLGSLSSQQTALLETAHKNDSLAGKDKAIPKLLIDPSHCLMSESVSKIVTHQSPSYLMVEGTTQH